MSEAIRVVVGLGNPGPQYRNTWHNLGFRVIGCLAERWKLSLRPGRGEYLFADTSRFGGVTLLVPTAFMNRSGSPVSSWLRSKRAEAQRMLVIYDDHDLPLGRIRLRENGSSGGHRGMEDIIRLVGQEDFPRVRIGIETDSEHADLADQVLAPIPPSYSGRVEAIIATAADLTEESLKKGIKSAMNKYNGIEIS